MGDILKTTDEIAKHTQEPGWFMVLVLVLLACGTVWLVIDNRRANNTRDARQEAAIGTLAANLEKSHTTYAQKLESLVGTSHETIAKNTVVLEGARETMSKAVAALDRRTPPR